MPSYTKAVQLATAYAADSSALCSSALHRAVRAGTWCQTCRTRCARGGSPARGPCARRSPPAPRTPQPARQRRRDSDCSWVSCNRCGSDAVDDWRCNQPGRKPWRTSSADGARVLSAARLGRAYMRKTHRLLCTSISLSSMGPIADTFAICLWRGEGPGRHHAAHTRGACSAADCGTEAAPHAERPRGTT